MRLSERRGCLHPAFRQHLCISVAARDATVLGSCLEQFRLPEAANPTISFLGKAGPPGLSVHYVAELRSERPTTFVINALKLPRKIFSLQPVNDFIIANDQTHGRPVLLFRTAELQHDLPIQISTEQFA